MYNFVKQNYIEVGRGVEYISYPRQVAILTYFDKGRLNDPNMNKLIEKSQKLNKNPEMCQFSTSNLFSGSAKHCGINF